MINIWGIGPKKAISLVKSGYTTIEKVRNGIKSGTLQLEERALVGVQFYEDFQEKMNRNEVEQISAIVKKAVLSLLPDAQVSTMGSFRRGKEQCGDVDILITHTKYVKNAPFGAVDVLVETLRENGHISHHLTSVNSTKTDFRVIDATDSLLVNHTKKSGSYMGVFVSPLQHKKHRRIDIKFYPFREKAFATLYFTGNGYFNRSMRLFAKRQMGLRLDDHGLFEYDGDVKVKRFEAKTEQQIFDYLGLTWREPNQRDSFDAVISNDSNVPIQVPYPDENDRDLEAQHCWID